MSEEFKDQFYQLLENRKSIRKFKKQSVAKELIEKIIQAGMQAPSGKNRQNWRFFVATGEKRDEYLKYSQKSWLGIKDILQKRLKPSLYEFTERFFYTLGEAPVIIFCYSHNDQSERYHTSVGSVYMAVENMNLACVAEGLGCCTMGAPLEIKEEVDAFTGADQWEDYKKGELELLCALVIGWPDHEPPKAKRQLENRITWL
ncbi:MAG: nitroreductase family protein [Bdellovibrionales bacterium]